MDKFDIYLFEQHYHDGQCHIEMDGNSLNMIEGDDCYMVQIEPPHPDMVCLLKTYNADTLTLKSEGNYLKLGGTEIGIWKTFDQFGEVIEETNYEEGWKTSWEDLLLLLSAEHIDLDNVVGISRYVEDYKAMEEETSENDGSNEEVEQNEIKEEDKKEDEEIEEDIEEEEESEEEEEAEEDLEEESAAEETDPVEEDFSPAYYWSITELLEDGSVKEHLFDSDYGKKVWDEQKIIKP